MRLAAFTAIFVAILGMSAVVLACPGSGKSGEMTWKSINVEQLKALRQEHAAKLAVYDVNSKETRSKHGVIPGARLLEAASSYPLTELPTTTDSMLVFYCANERCTASHTAAERATQAGFSSVYVLSPGIVGWQKSGEPVASMPQT